MKTPVHDLYRTARHWLGCTLVIFLTMHSGSRAAEFAIFGGSSGGGGSSDTAVLGPGGEGSETDGTGGKGGDSEDSGGGGGEGWIIDGTPRQGGEDGASGGMIYGGKGGGAAGGPGGMAPTYIGGDGSGQSGGGGGAINAFGTGGDGGNGGSDGGGGGGGGAGRDAAGAGGSGGIWAYTMNSTEYSTVSLRGGNGGGGGSAHNAHGGHGGNAASVEVATGAILSTTGTITIEGGNGGAGGDYLRDGLNKSGGNGGAGGDAILNASGKTVIVQGGVSMTSGKNGDDGIVRAGTGAGGSGGAGGNASFTAGILTAPSIHLVKQDADLTFAVGTLNVTQNTSFTMDKGTASGGTFSASVNGLSFSGGHSLSITAKNGATFAAFGGDIAVFGKDNTMTTPVRYDAKGSSLDFDLTGLDSGTALTVNGPGIEVDNTTSISLTGISSFIAGQQASLLQSTIAGSFDPSQLGERTAIDSGVTTTYTLTQASDLLSVYSKRTATADDYAIPDTYTMKAGVGAGETAELDIGGKLTVGGTGLTVIGNSTNAATVKAGTLVAESLNLSGTNATATIDNLDMSANGTALHAASGTSIAVTAAALSSGNTFLLDNSSGAVTVGTLNVIGAGNHLEVTTATQSITTLNAAGAELIFALPNGIAANDTVVNVATADVSGTTVGIAAKTALTLTEGQRITLLAASGSLTGTITNNKTSDSFGNTYRTYTSGNSLIAEIASVLSFTEKIDSLFGDSGLNNVNLHNGGEYLDRLSQTLPNTDPVTRRIEDGFLAVVGLPDPPLAAAATQQFFGGYAAYAGQALSSDADRFRTRWQTRNNAFLIASIFSRDDLSRTSTGIGSSAALASPETARNACTQAGSSQIWAGGFGSWADQKSRNNLPGYKYDSRGLALGYEYTRDQLNIGVAAAYSQGDLKVSDLRYKNEADVLNLALYGAYIHESGLYAHGGLGYGHAWNDYTVDYIAVPGGVKKAKYGSDTFTADLELGYVARLPQDFALIPSVGVEYTYLKNNAWTEKVDNAAIVANRFNRTHDNGIDIPLGFRLNKLFRFGSDTVVTPEIRAAYVYSANKSRPSITAGFADAPGGAIMRGVDFGRSHWRLGAGISGNINRKVDLRVDYDLDTRSGYRGHNLNVSIGLSF